MNKSALILCIFVLLMSGLFSLERSDLAQREIETIKTPGSRSVNIQTIGNNLTPQDMLDSILGSNVDISNLQYTGADTASGVFTNGFTAGMNIDEGIVLSCGRADYCIGPNQTGSSSWINFGPGDTDLNTLIPGYSTHDASILEFDFVPDFNVITFNYVFASEEYPEWVGSSFNDVFGFFLDGENIAIIPGTDIPVAINNVNDHTNSDYYVANHDFYGTYDFEPDGFTVSLSATAVVNPGQTHHIRLAIADAGDYALDSWVFIEAESFTSPGDDDLFTVDVGGGVVQETDEDVPLDIPVTVHGLDNSHFYWVLSNPIWGTVEIIEERDDIDTKIIRYTPNPNYNGYDSFVLAVHNMIDNCIYTPISVLVVHQNDPPACSVLPSITGNFVVGETVTCDQGEWNDDVDNLYVDPGEESTIELFYQWQRMVDEVWIDIPGANYEEYVIEEFCLDLPLHCRIYAQDDGTGMGGNNTSFADSNEEIVTDGTAVDNPSPFNNGLVSIYPNPFNPETNIKFAINMTRDVELSIFNTKGQKITTLVQSTLSAGKYEVMWDGNDAFSNKVTSGIYFISLSLDGDVELSKIVLLK